MTKETAVYTLRLLSRPFEYLAFVCALVALSVASRLLGETHELGYFSGRLSRALWRYPEITRRGVQTAWVVWAVVFGVAASPFDPLATWWDAVALATVAAVFCGAGSLTGDEPVSELFDSPRRFTPTGRRRVGRSTVAGSPGSRRSEVVRAETFRRASPRRPYDHLVGSLPNSRMTVGTLIGSSSGQDRRLRRLNYHRNSPSAVQADG